MLTVHSALGFGAAFVSVLLGATPALAQRRDPAQLLSAYVQERQTPRGQSSAFRDLVHAVNNHGDYPAADLESVLRGLEEVALTGMPPRFRAEAASLLTVPGSSRAVHPLRGRFSRLERVCRESTDPVVRIVLIRGMGDQVDRREAAGFLEGVATRDSAGFAPEPRYAIKELLRMDEEGRRVLKQLHDRDAVRNPEAKAMLAVLAKYDFREPPSP
jgi:hypothetical protein